MDSNNAKQVYDEDLEIHDHNLLELLAEVDVWFGEGLADSSPSIIVDSPFTNFVQHWERFQSASQPQESDGTPARRQARADLGVLLKILLRSDSLKSYFKFREQMKSSKKIRFEHLWTLFSHSTKVYALSYANQIQMFEVIGCSGPSSKGSKRFTVWCSGFDWDGSKFCTYEYDFHIKEFSGEKPIHSLDIFPIEFYLNNDGRYDDSGLRQKLLERGRKYCDLCLSDPSTFQCTYAGPALVTPSSFHRLALKGRNGEDLRPDNTDQAFGQTGWSDYEVTSIDIGGNQNQVIVDNYAFLKSKRNEMNCSDMPPLGSKRSFRHSYCFCATCESSTIQQWRPVSQDRSLYDLRKSFSDVEARLLFLPPRLLGYGLKDKIWGQFQVDRLSRITSEQNAQLEEPFLKELQLEDDSKDLLMAYVKHHGSASLRKLGEESDRSYTKTFDIVEGKGLGLVIMLHGPPGVGKTLTAETIAMATGKPLLSVSVADIGTKPQESEQKLTDVFEDAARWGAVLLMDEADVFVEERVKGELDRNALVSVLLRCLEYYDGKSIQNPEQYVANDLIEDRHHHSHH